MAKPTCYHHATNMADRDKGQASLIYRFWLGRAEPYLVIMAAPVRSLRAVLSDERLLLTSLLAFALAARIAMALTVPPWQGPDEPKHFEHIRMLVDKRAQLWNERRLLVIDDASPEFQGEVIRSMAKYRFWEYWGRSMPPVMPKSFYEIWLAMSTQLHRPSLYYFLGAASLLPFQGASIELQLLVVRLLSAVSSTLSVALTYIASRELVPKDRFVPVVSAAFVAALPMHVFIGGTVNTDNLVTTWGSMAALGLAMGVRRGFTLRRLAFLFGALALAVSTKRTAVGLTPAVLLSVPLWLLSLPGRVRLFVGSGLTLGGVLVAVAIVGGSPARILRFDGLREMVTAYALNEADQFERLLQVPFGSEKAGELIVSHLVWLFQSFWGIFGWFNVPLSPGLYYVIAMVSVACAAGLIAWLAFQMGAQIRRPVASRAAQILGLVVFGVAIASMVVLAVGERLAYYAPTQIPQGRYLFVAVAPIAVTYAVGARALLPQRFLGTWGPILLCVLALVLLDVIVLTRHILPFYVWRVFS